MAWKLLGCYNFKRGKIGGGSLSGWFTAKQGWLNMRLSGDEGWECDRRKVIKVWLCALY